MDQTFKMPKRMYSTVAPEINVDLKKTKHLDIKTCSYQQIVPINQTLDDAVLLDFFDVWSFVKTPSSVEPLFPGH